MPLNLNKKELTDLIESMEAGGNDTSELRRELDALPPEDTPRPAKPTREPSRIEEEEELTEERLFRRVGYLFTGGVPLQEIINYDERFTLKELREQVKEKGIGISGDKKELAAKLIAHQRQRGK